MRQHGISSLVIIGCGFFIVVLIGVFMNGYESFRKQNAGYSFDDLKARNTVVSDPRIYDFMNFALFDADSALSDQRAFIKLNSFTLKHSSKLKNFIRSANDTLFSKADKKYLETQLIDDNLLWDCEKFVNVWCLTPKHLSKLQNNDTIDYWVNFRAQFGNYGHHYYSKPIFNKDGNMVIVEHSGQGDWLLGSGSILIFRKNREGWKLIEEWVLWIS